MEGKVEDSTYNVSGVEPLADNSLAQDLQMSPDNSDDDSGEFKYIDSNSYIVVKDKGKKEIKIK